MTDERDPDYVPRTLPQALDAEKAVLGAVLVNNAAFDRVATVIRADHFFRRAHSSIFKAIAELLDAKVDVDLVTLNDHLGKAGLLEDVGGPAYISSLTDGVPRSTNAAHYAGIVREKWLLRRLIAIGSEALGEAYDAEKPAAEIVEAVDRQILGLQRGDAGVFTDLRDRHGALSLWLEERAATAGQLLGVTTGFKTLDEQTSGWQRKDMIVVAARPSMGKTAFILNTAAAAARTGARVALFSLEMRTTQMETRLLAAASGVPASRIREGYFGESDFAGLAEGLTAIDQLPILMNDRSGQTVWDIRASCRRLKADGGLGLVVIDYIQLMHGSVDRRGASRNDEMTDISRRLKILADELDVPILVVSQLNRGAEGRSDPRPKLSDLRESGALEQDADVVVFLHRKHHREGGLTECIIEKQRNGPTGTVNLSFDRERQTFTDQGLEPEPQELPADVETPARKTRNAVQRWRSRKDED